MVSRTIAGIKSIGVKWAIDQLSASILLMQPVPSGWRHFSESCKVEVPTNFSVFVRLDAEEI
ncbi:hypothetical protein GCM10028825_13910 [Spirosoma agri]